MAPRLSLFLTLALIALQGVGFAAETDYQRLVETMQRWQARYPELVSAVPIGWSHDGRDLTILRITTSKENAPGVYLGSSIHGHEGSHKDLIEIVDRLLARSKEPRTAALLTTRVLWVQPLINPDGVVSGTRKNARGVDLNRNFGYRWGTNWKDGRPPAEHSRHPGPKAFSEPETTALRRFLVAREEITMFVDLHRSARILFVAYGAQSAELLEGALDLLRRAPAHPPRPRARLF